MEDQRIIELFEQRKESAVSVAHSKYGNYCFKIAWNVLKDEEDVKECVNDTWMRVWDLIPPQKPLHLSSFLGKITRNLALDKYRKSNAAKRSFPYLCQPIEELEEIIPSQKCLDENINHQTLVFEINVFLSKLTQIDRVLFVRRYFFMDTTKELQQRFDLKESTIKVKLYRIRKSLKEHLIQEGLYDERF